MEDWGTLAADADAWALSMAALVALLDVTKRTAVVVDKGHRHCSGHSEIVLWRSSLPCVDKSGTNFKPGDERDRSQAFGKRNFAGLGDQMQSLDQRMQAPEALRRLEPGLLGHVFYKQLRLLPQALSSIGSHPLKGLWRPRGNLLLLESLLRPRPVLGRHPDACCEQFQVTR